MQKTLFILLLFLSISSRLPAITDTSGLTHFDLDNGFPSNNVYSLLQDRNGYLWFATEKGVVKYNGYTLKTFNTANGLPSDDIWQLLLDKRGRIWVNSFSYEFGYIQNDAYKAISIKPRGNMLIQHTFVDDSVYLSLLFLTRPDIVTLALIKEDVVAEFPIVVAGKNFLGIPDSIIATFIHPSNSYHFYAASGDIYKWKPRKDKKVKKWCNIKRLESLWDAYRFDLLAGSDVYYYIPNQTLINKFNLETCAYKSVDIKDFGAKEGESIYTYIRDFSKPGKYRGIVTTKDNFYFINGDLSLEKKESIRDIVPTGSQVVYRFVDNSNNVWYPTKGDGVWRQKDSSFLLGEANDLQALRNCKYVGLIDDSITYWWNADNDMLHGVIKNEIIESINLPGGSFINRVSGSGDRLFMALASGLYMYDKSRKSTISLRTAIAGALRDSIMDSELLHNQRILFENGELYTVRTKGVCHYSFGKVIETRSKVDNERYNDLYNDRLHNKLWLYNYNQVVVYDKKTGSKLTVKPEFLKQLGDINIKKIAIDKYYNIYLLEGSKIAVYNPHLNKKITLYRNFSLRDATLQIVNDKLVIGGLFGIAYADISGALKLSAFSIMPNTSFYSQLEDMAIDEKGYIILKTNRGTKAFHLDELSRNAQLKAKDNYSISLISKQPNAVLIRQKDTLFFDQRNGNMQLDVVNLNGKGAVSYWYRISKTGDWKESTSGEVFLSDLQAGEYYRMDCIVSDDILRSYPFTFYVYRYPYWWQTSRWKLIFWVSGSILLAGLILIVILATRHFVAKKNAKRRAQTELELRAIHSQINPHFIFNTLSTALYFINKKRFDDAYIHVNKFSRLLRSYLKASQDRYTILGDEIQMLKNYIELQQTRFEQKFTYNIEIDNKIPVNNIQIPSLLLQPLIENAINHGLFHRESGGELIIKFLQGGDNTELVCVIDDNGVGRAKAKEINDASSTKDSYGTKLTNQLLEVFKEYEHMNIEMNYTDKEPSLSGTIVTLIIKKVKYIA